MQKNKKATVTMIAIIFAYGLLSQFVLSTKINTIYTYIINPIIWIAIAIFLRYVLGKQYETKKLKKEIIT